MTRPNSFTRSVGIPLTVAAGGLALAGAGLAWLAYMRRNIWHDVPLTAALDGELRIVPTSAGDAGYYFGPAAPVETRPLFLIHSVNAAASAYEMKPLFDRFAGRRPVAAMDLPGFGFSDRDQRRLTSALYADAVVTVLEDAFDGRAADVVALSLGAEFAALAAAKRPELFRTLALISPTGMRATAGRGHNDDRALNFLRRSGAGQPIFDTLVSRPSLRFFLGQAQRRGFDLGLFHYAYASSHQPGASNAPFHFITGKLFTPGIALVYESLSMPCLALLAGDPYASAGVPQSLIHHANWQIVDWSDRCGSLAHFDDPDGVVQLIEIHTQGQAGLAPDPKNHP